MASTYVLSSAQLDYLQCGTSRFQVYLAFHDPIATTAYSQDISYDSTGQPIVNPPTDLLALGKAPFNPTVNCGSNRIGFVNEPLYFDGLRSVQRGNILAWGHTWSATGPAVLTTYSSPVIFPDVMRPDPSQIGNQQCSIVWSAPGNYHVTLTTSDRYGNVSVGTRQVRIYTDRETAQNNLIQIGGLSGGITSGGWTCDITAVASTPGFVLPDSLPVGTYLPMTLIVETEYDLVPGTSRSVTISPYGTFVAGQPYDDPRILFCGYIKTGTCTQVDEFDLIEFAAQTPDLVASEANVLTTAFYDATFTTKNSAGHWDAQASTFSQPDQLVAGCASVDIYTSMLRDHCTIGQYHDIITWHDWIPDPAHDGYVAAPEYSGTTINNGTIMAGLASVAQNEFGSLWCERDGSFRAGPTINFRGATTWGWYQNAPIIASGPTNTKSPTNGKWPTKGFQPIVSAYNTAFPTSSNIVIPPIVNPAFTMVNLWQIYSARAEFLGSYIPTGKTAYDQLPGPAAPVWTPIAWAVWGPNAMPQPITITGEIERNPAQSLIMPVLCHYSDTPEYDGTENLALTPIEIDIAETYTGRAAFVKFIGTKVFNDTVWSAFYPVTQNGSPLFAKSGQMLQRLPVGGFVLVDQLVIPDLGAKAADAMSWSYLWQITRLAYYHQNGHYTATVKTGMGNYTNLHDLVYLSRQHVQNGPRFAQKLFYIDQISYSIDLKARTWNSQFSCLEVTSHDPAIATPVIPPWGVPA